MDEENVAVMRGLGWLLGTLMIVIPSVVALLHHPRLLVWALGGLINIVIAERSRR